MSNPDETPTEQDPFDQQLEDAIASVAYWTASDEEQDNDDE